jgi:hypothetical protein
MNKCFDRSAEEGIIKAFDNNADIYITQDREHLLSKLDNTSLYIGMTACNPPAAMMGINTIASS